MADVNLTYTAGTVTVNANGIAAVGVGTVWSPPNVFQWDHIHIDPANSNIILPITAISSSTQLAIPQWKGGAKSNVPYVIYQDSPIRQSSFQTMKDVSNIVAAMNTDGYYFYVSAVETVPNANYGNEGQYALQATTGKLWLKSGGIWVYVGINKGFGLPAPWSSGTAYKTYDVASLNGSSYVCILAHANQAPPNATYWTLLASIGPTGSAATVSVGTVTTGAAGSSASVTNSGSSGAAILNFTIPRGSPGGGDMLKSENLAGLDPATSRASIGAAKSGANTDITSLAVLNAAISTTAKGSTFGGATGTHAAPANTDANIKLYDNGGGNWAGLIADSGGSIGIRVGLSGAPDSAFVMLSSGDASFKKDLSWVGSGLTAYTPTQTGTATGTASGRYKYFGKVLVLMLRFLATSTGTVILSLPPGATTSGLTGSGAGRENGLTGVGLVAYVQAGKVIIGTYNAANPTGNGAVAEVAMIIEVV